MTRQNVYDNDMFFTGYQSMRDAGSGLNEALEQPALRALLPETAGVDAVDLGCGDGTLTRLLAEQGARSVLGVDPSSRMLALATARTQDSRVRYQQDFAEDVRLPMDSVDLVVSSLAMHYIADVGRLLSQVRSWLRPGGVLVASVEHPMVTAEAGQAVHAGEASGYADEGPRRTRWFDSDVVKHHRMVSTNVREVLAAGFILTALAEPVPSPAMLEHRPNLAVHRQRPPLLLIRGQRAR